MSRRTVTLLLTTSALGACAPARCGDAPTAATEDLDLLVGGCAAVVERGELCELDGERTLHLWAAGADPIHVEADSRPLAARQGRVEGGQQAIVTVPSGATRLHARQGSALAEVRVRELEEHPALVEARRLRAEGDLDGASAALDRATDASDRGAVLGLRARIALRRGDAEGSIAQLRDAIAADREAGQTSAEVRDAAMLAFLLRAQGRRFSEARAALDASTGAADRWDEGAALRDYYLAVIDWDTGDQRNALRRLVRAERAARRLGMTSTVRDAIQMRALVLQQLGRHQDAAAALDSLAAAVGRGGSACERAGLWSNVGWGRYLRRELEGTESGQDPRRPLTEALDLYRTACPDRGLEANAILNLGLEALQRGHIETAREHLAEARSLNDQPDAVTRAWWLLLEAASAHQAGDHAHAQAAWLELAQRAEATADAEVAWRADVGRAEALASLGRADEAIEALQGAEARLDSDALAAPIGQGREAFLADRGRSAQRLVELLVAAGRAEEAAGVARRARARVVARFRRAGRIAQLPAKQRERWEQAVAAYRRQRDTFEADAAADWGRPADQVASLRAERAEQRDRLASMLDDAFGVLGGADMAEALAAPGSDELMLVLFGRARAGGVFGFALTGAGTRAVRLGSLDGLLAPFAAELEAARRVRVLALGDAEAVEVHALPWCDDVLGACREVVYGLDLPTPTARTAAKGAVIADPTGDLPEARVEADEVIATGLASGETALLRGRDATRQAVLDALATADVLHYAGHAKHDGLGGWDSALPLADDQSLRVGDVLALPRVPQHVVLSACEAGLGEALGLGLAQAFVAAGALEVVAPSRPVDDDLARQLSVALHAHRSTHPDDTLAAALGAAQRVVREENDAADWAAYRIWAP